MKEAYKIRRTLCTENLRILCIKNDWYRCGDNDDYAHMLNKAKKGNITSNDIVSIARDIITHSNLTSDDLLWVCDEILSITRSFMCD